MTAELRLDTREVDALLKKLGRAATDGTQPLTRLDRYVRTDMAREWNKARANGGEVRGYPWEGLSPRYKKRPSGQKVTASSVINKDTGRLQAAIVSSPTRIVRKTLLLIGAVLPRPYGEHVLSIGNRNILRWQLPRDQQAYHKIAGAWLRELVRKSRRRA